ncbi:AsnC family transcriptional regulator [Nocardiopsis sp. TSRI0078]|uniref:Lrp/AsnC family transcriptional regulator n=1 Tax=unclassified Nocardiopsis TaxID=2649073 RepID=UPI000938C1C8|nr:AsnC family transcriptional regulator [Nocardiopsis sp. TSRI0078]OKI18403.1 AsnC family transcriptional regulator [Nocardiopsis sp. TSRI0078]
MAPQTLDVLDLKLLQALELDGRAPFSRIARVLGVSDQTIARRFGRLRTTARLRVTGMTDDGRLGRDSWIVRLGCTPNVAGPLALALARRPDTQYVDLASGGTEVVCVMRPRTRRERDELLLERLQRTPRVTSVSAHCILHSFYGGPLGWLRKTSALEADEEAALRPPATEPTAAPIVLDAVDEALLAELRQDGRAALARLRAATGRSEAVVGRRLERLRATGVLYFAVEYDHEPLGQGVEAMCWLTVAPHALADAGRAVADHSEVRFAAAVTGPANLALSLLCRTTGDLYAYLSEGIGALDGVRTAETTLTLRRVKTLTYPAP